MIQKKRYISQNEAEGLCAHITRHILKAGIRVKAVIGIVRGGLAPAVMLSHYYGCPLYTIDYSLRDRNDAQEFSPHDSQMLSLANLQTEKGGHVLIVDDINDSGDTLKAVKDFVDHEYYADIFKYVTLLEKCTSKFDCDFYGEMLDDSNDDWIVFPWEDWWLNKD